MTNSGARTQPSNVAGGGSPKGPPLATVGIVFVLVLFWTVYTSSVLPWARQHDFLSFYTGASFALEGRFGDLYDPAAQLEFQRRIVPGATDIAPYIRPNFYAAAIAPLALLPFHTAFWVWMVSHWLVLIACWIWAGRHFGWDAMIWGAMYFPTVAGISNGQDCSWLLAIVVGAYILVNRRRDAAAGLVLGLALFKFNLLLLAPLGMLAARRWRMLAGYGLAGAATGFAFLALGGLSQLPSYRALLTNPDLTWLEPNATRMINLASITANLGLPSFLTWVMAAAVAAAALLVARRAVLWRWFATVLIGSVLVNPHAYAYDGALLLLPLWLILFRGRGRALRVLSAAVAVPLPFFTMLADSPWLALPALLYTAIFAALVWESWPAPPEGAAECALAASEPAIGQAPRGHVQGGADGPAGRS